MRFNSLDFWKPQFTTGKDFSALQKSINRLFDEAFTTAPAATSFEVADFSPECDLEETETQYRMHFDLPGMKMEEIKVEVIDNQVTVRGERHNESKMEDKKRKVYERRYGKFERTFVLPASIDAARVEATYDKGVLRITIPKTDAIKPRQVAVKELAATAANIKEKRQ